MPRSRASRCNPATQTWYKGAWYRGPDRDRLRIEYNNDRTAYYNAYCPTSETSKYLEDTLLAGGMKLFAEWAARLTRQMRRAPYIRNGQGALEDLLTALAHVRRPSRDYLFVAIDFEGTDDKWGLKELGIASFESRQIFDDSQQTLKIDGESYALANHRRRKFMFGNTLKLTEEMLPKVLRDLLDSYQDRYSGGVILVGHGTGSDLKIIENHGVTVESLPAVIGMVDTSVLCRRKLSDALRVYDIPCRVHSLHCAGNDVHYSLRLMLAVMLENLGQRTHEVCSRATALRELIERPLPIPPAHLRIRDYDDDWQQHIDGEDLCMDFILDLTDDGA